MEYTKAWLAQGPPYYGTSDFNDRKIIGKAGGRFSRDRKLWYAEDKSVFISMVETEKWFPVDVNGREAARLIRAERQDVEDKRTAAITAQRAKNVPTAEQLAERQRKELGIPDDSADDLKQLSEMYGIEPQMVHATRFWANLGPKGGLSDAKRLLRGLHFNIVTKNEVRAGAQAESAYERNKRIRMEHGGGTTKPIPTPTATKKPRPKPVGTVAPAAPTPAAPTPAAPTAVPAHAAFTPYTPYTRETLAEHGGWDDQPHEATHLCDDEHTHVWPHVEIKWVRDTVCNTCQQPVTDQFLDCRCPDAVWAHCVQCREKYRLGAGVPTPKVAKCGKCARTAS